MTKTAMIECPSCGGNGGMGVYCEDCQCTGSVSVPTNVAELLAWLGKHATAQTRRVLTAERHYYAMSERWGSMMNERDAAFARAEAAEADARVLRTLLRTAVIHHIAPLALAPHETRNIGDLMTEYVDALFEAAGDNGAFANDQCNPAAVARVAESLGATLDDLPEPQP